MKLAALLSVYLRTAMQSLAAAVAVAKSPLNMLSFHFLFHFFSILLIIVIGARNVCKMATQNLLNAVFIEAFKNNAKKLYQFEKLRTSTSETKWKTKLNGFP